MKLRLIAVGRPRQKSFQLAESEYRRRLEGYLKLEVVEVRDGKQARLQANLLKEAESILPLLRPGEQTVLLDSTGQQWTSPEWANWLAAQQSLGVTLVIGSSYGVDPSVRARATTLWSLSKLTFPHELARVLVLEQVYRAVTILAGHPYHH